MILKGIGKFEVIVQLMEVTLVLHTIHKSRHFYIKIQCPILSGPPCTSIILPWHMLQINRFLICQDMVNEFYLFDQESRLNFHPISNGLEQWLLIRG